MPAQLDPITSAIRAAKELVYEPLREAMTDVQIQLVLHNRPEFVRMYLSSDAVRILDALNPAWVDAVIGDDLDVSVFKVTIIGDEL